MKKEFETRTAQETQALGKALAEELHGGEIICLVGELGAGKTTFSQGFLAGFKIPGPYTSPTFVIMKEYKIKNNIGRIYHIDAYRVGEKNILDLGFQEIISGGKNVVIIEWADKIRKIIPQNSIWIKFELLDQDKRKISVTSE